jgi:hypothetical protein
MKRIRVWGTAGTWLALALLLPQGVGAETLSSVVPAESSLESAVPTTWLAAGLITGLGEARKQPAPTPRVRPRLRRQRPNTISLGLQGQYGVVRGNSRIADGFDQGPGYAFRFRYMLSPSSALGFSFEHQRYGSIQTPLNQPGAFADSHVVITTVAAEAVFFRNRASDMNPYFLGGIGYATPDVVYTDSQSSRVNEGMFATAGLGFERFVRPRFSIDVSVRGYAFVTNSEFTSIAQVGLGIHLYPGD